MTDFSNLARQKVSSNDTVTYELYGIDMPDASLTVAPATRANKGFNSASLLKALPMQRRAGGKMTPDLVDAHRNDLIPIYANHVIKGWTKVVDANGNEVPFSKENALAFLQALPEQEMDNLVEFCSNEANFREATAEEVAKN